MWRSLAWMTYLVWRELFVEIGVPMFNVQCFFYAYFKITIGRINHFETITRVVVFTGCAWWQMFFDRRRWSSMFPYPCGQMSDSFANIGRICITQTFFFFFRGERLQIEVLILHNSDSIMRLNIWHYGITQTCKLIYDIGHQGHRGMSLQGKIIFHFEWGEHHFNINAIIFLE